MQVECYENLSEELAAEWAAFLAQANHQHPRQDIRFADSERAEGGQVLFAMGRENGAMRAVGLFKLNRHRLIPNCYSEALCLSGPVCDDPKHLIHFLDGVAQHPILKRTGQIKVTPYWMADEAETLHSAFHEQGWVIDDPETYRQTGWVDITPSPDDILAKFSKSARREVRRAGRQDIYLSIIQQESAALEFLDSLNRLRTSRKLPPIGKAGFEASFKAIYKTADTGVILGAYHKNTFISGLLLYRSRDVAHGRHFTTEPKVLRELGNLRIAPFLWLEGMKWARAHGCAALDVEGYRAAESIDNKMTNIYKYKSEFGPRPLIRLAEHKKRTNVFLDLTGNGKVMLKSYLKGMSQKYRRMRTS